jgi:hypothetical protein
MINYIEKNLGKICFIFLYLSLFISFIFNLDSAGSGGHIADFYNTWGYVEDLTINFSAFPIKHGSDNTPLNYMILSWINYIFHDEYIVRFIYCAISIILPILFYYALKDYYEDIDNNTLLLLASLIFLLPSFRSGAVWANHTIMQNVFLLIFVIFFNKWLKRNEFDKININIFYQLFFLALAVYTIQTNAVIYLYAMYIYFKKLSIKNFLIVSFIVFIFALPGFWLLFNEPTEGMPRMLTSVFSPKIYNTILITPSILSFYLIPIFFILFLNKIYKFDFKDKYNILSSIFFIILISVITIIFDYNYRIGGGFFIKLSFLVFGNIILGSLTSIIGLVLLFHIAREHKDNLILIIMLVFTYFSYYIFQKYYEPMFFLIFFLMFKSNIPKFFLRTKKNIYYLALYLVLYLASGILNDIFKITKTFIS